MKVQSAANSFFSARCLLLAASCISLCFPYFGPNNSNTSGSLSGGLAVEGSDFFLAFFAVSTLEGFDCFLFAEPTIKLRGIGF
jgi:hypothetical protein